MTTLGLNPVWPAPPKGRRLSLMGHVIADYPSPDAVRSMIEVMVNAGCGVIEIQIPFSEPMADGPVFLAANHRALAQGVDYKASLALLNDVATKYPDVRFVVMTYLNVVYRRGYAHFVEEAKGAGAAGLILPDLPFDLATELEAACEKKAFINIPLIPPNAAGARLQGLAARATAGGLAYVVARTGVTGQATAFGVGLDHVLGRLKPLTAAKLALGFGVKEPAHIAALVQSGLADYAVVGTAGLEAMEHGGLQNYESFWAGLAAATI